MNQQGFENEEQENMTVKRMFLDELYTAIRELQSEYDYQLDELLKNADGIVERMRIHNTMIKIDDQIKNVLNKVVSLEYNEKIGEN